VEDVGAVFRRRSGPALLVSPMTIDEPMKRAMPAFWNFDSRSWLGEVSTPALMLDLFDEPSPVERRAIAVAGQRYGAFLGLQAEVTSVLVRGRARSA
jgi:hypothetical protein